MARRTSFQSTTLTPTPRASRSRRHRRRLKWSEFPASVGLTHCSHVRGTPLSALERTRADRYHQRPNQTETELEGLPAIAPTEQASMTPPKTSKLAHCGPEEDSRGGFTVQSFGLRVECHSWEQACSTPHAKACYHARFVHWVQAYCMVLGGNSVVFARILCEPCNFTRRSPLKTWRNSAEKSLFSITSTEQP
jgi:hypothetical protein